MLQEVIRSRIAVLQTGFWDPWFKPCRRRALPTWYECVSSCRDWYPPSTGYVVTTTRLPFLSPRGDAGREARGGEGRGEGWGGGGGGGHGVVFLSHSPATGGREMYFFPFSFKKKKTTRQQIHSGVSYAL